MSSPRAAALIVTLCLAGCTAPPTTATEPDLEDADPDALTWVAPAVTDTVLLGAPMDLVVSTGNTDVHAVAFSVDGQSIGGCDTWSDAAGDGGDCNADDLWRTTTTLATAGVHHLGASFDLADGTHVAIARDVTATASEANGGGNDPEASESEADPVPAGTSSADEPVGVDVQAITAARGYLDASHGWIDRGGDVAWRVAGQRILVRPVGTTGDGRAEIGDVGDVTDCMASYGASFIRYADLSYVSRPAIVAMAIAVSGCGTEPDDDGPEVGLMQMTGAECVAEWAVAGSGTLSAAACRQRMIDSSDFAIQIGALRMARLARRYHHDPVELAAAYTAGALRASRSNRFHLASEPGSLEDFVEAYNAYRSWEALGGSPTATASAVRTPAAADPATFHDPCRHPGPNAIRQPGADGIFHGTEGDDVIVGTGGDDEIHGGGGHDVLCGRAGNDHIYGEAGNDYIDAGGGNDFVDGGVGNDVIHGRDGSDELHGGDGNDFIDGDLLDDDIFGEAGNDVLVGGHGTDFLDGGPDDDTLRGDTGRDTFLGGAGNDTVSFATTTPHGTSPTGGVHVDFTARLDGMDPVDASYIQYLHTAPHVNDETMALATDPTGGLEDGDGNHEYIAGVEHIIGSAFDDTVTHSPTTTGITVAGGLGNDRCDGGPCDSSEAAVPAGPYVMLDPTADGVDGQRGLVVLGGGGADRLSVKVLGDDVTVTSLDTGVTLTAGSTECAPAGGPSVLRCALHGDALRYVVMFGGAGADRLRIDGRIPRDATGHMNGGPDDDELSGSSGQDVMFTGLTGHDTLRGNRADDALLGEGGSASPDGDSLWGGRQNDQLVVDYICAGHHFHGGPGFDISGFRRSGNDDITAELGGKIADAHIHHLSDGRSIHGRALNPAVCLGDATAWTRIAGGLEVLEASDGNDELYGDDGPNTIWAWGGNDNVHGNDGDDVLEGDDGNDDIYGDAGSDRMMGGPGPNDRIFAQDGRIDALLSCGPDGGNVASSDPGESASDCH